MVSAGSHVRGETEAGVWRRAPLPSPMNVYTWGGLLRARYLRPSWWEARPTPDAREGVDPTCCLLVGPARWTFSPWGLSCLWDRCLPSTSSRWGRGAQRGSRVAALEHPGRSGHSVGQCWGPPYRVLAVQEWDRVVPGWRGPEVDIHELGTASLHSPTVCRTVGCTFPS